MWVRRKFHSLKLFVFGDSWPYGAELKIVSEKTFGELIASANGWEFYKYAFPGKSIHHLVLQLEQAIKEHDVTDSSALFCLTSASRSMHYLDGQWQELQIHRQQTHSQQYFKYFYSPELANHQANVNILALQHICEKYKIKDYYVSSWDQINLTLPAIDRTRFLDQTLVDILGCVFHPDKEINIDKTHPLIAPNHYHPNAQGHQVIANKLNEWIITNAS
jgi:hypothetical protein